MRLMVLLPVSMSKILMIHSPIHVDGVYSLRCKIFKKQKSSYKCKECSTADRNYTWKIVSLPFTKVLKLI